ncbi:MAG: DUF3365 domain-containing protein [Planctomycetota bacterium]|nr:DUF3365 domain-containing protein [Planctomycetota bacterium]
MPKIDRKITILVLVVAAAAIVGSYAVNGTGAVNAATAVEKAKDPGVERARREVLMLDDIYKTAIVLVTEHYVHDDTDLAAGSAFKALFEAVSKKGWHTVRLVDATGEPYSDLNLPKEGFEKKSIQQLLDGKTSVDEVVVEGDKKFLLAATAIPVVMEKCIMCHENYRNVPKGKAIGALSYKVPILD